MHSHMHIVLRLLGKIRIADLADVRLNRGVLLHVRGQILIWFDGLMAYFTFKLTQLVVLLIDVGAQSQFSGKLAFANGAFVLHTLLMALHVHTQIGIGGKAGRALGAVELLDAHLVVGHHMLLELSWTIRAISFNMR